MKKSSLCWLLLCLSPFCQAQLRQSCDHLQEQIDNGEATPAVFFQAASCFASNDQKEVAFEFLKLAVDNGFRDSAQAQAEFPLKKLQGDPRWQELMEKIKRGEKEFSAKRNDELLLLFEAHMTDRDHGQTTSKADRQRLLRVEQILVADGLKVAEDYFEAATIYLNGETAAQLQKAAELAKAALNLDPNITEANGIICAAEDRELMLAGKLQVWGTQLVEKEGVWSLAPMDAKARTDKQRNDMGLPDMESIQRHLSELNTRSEH